MSLPYRYAGRDFTEAEITFISALCADRSTPTREAIARAACQALNWRAPNGKPKIMSAKVAFLAMCRDGLINLPAPLHENRNGRTARHLPAPTQDLHRRPPPSTLDSLGEIRLRLVKDRADSATWNETIARYHYLGYVPLAGAQLRYLIEADCGPLGALSFGASAWKCADRDTHIGWDPATREQRLHLVVGNARFLILPDIKVPNLASSVLARATRRLPIDWQATYAYTPVLVETFVETDRFAGTSYRAANWIRVGHTKGRGKLDRTHAKPLPIKDIYLYPLHHAYKTILTAPPPT